ncbi:unnamed protein product [Phytophthora lilii]|uniref:Unnamed protein product n=1 Tax=Phytophthora lilii TaxID=2077276 RepID=A0A9W6U265_9STRA|nr:unnamed protein product [Phytophthora lilii]
MTSAQQLRVDGYICTEFTVPSLTFEHSSKRCIRPVIVRTPIHEAQHYRTTLLPIQWTRSASRLANERREGLCCKIEFKTCSVKTVLKQGGTLFVYYLLKPFEMWIVIGYFLLVKVVIGVMSAGIIFLIAILPFLALFGSANALFFTNWISFYDNPVVYIVVTTSLWIFVIFGLVVVAAMSMHLISLVFGELKAHERENCEQNQDAEAGAMPVDAFESPSTLMTTNAVTTA